MRTMYDSINIANIPNDSAELVAGYVDGKWPTFDSLVQKFPNKLHVPITAIPSTDLSKVNLHGAKAIGIDVESGDYSPESCASQALKAVALGLIPIPYVNHSNKSLVAQAFAYVKLSPPLFWLAYPGMVTIPDDCVAVQNYFPGPFDRSIVKDYFPGIDRKRYQMLFYGARGIDYTTASVIVELGQVGVATCSISEAQNAIARGDDLFVIGGPAAQSLKLEYNVGQITSHPHITVAVGQTAKDSHLLSLKATVGLS